MSLSVTDPKAASEPPVWYAPEESLISFILTLLSISVESLETVPTALTSTLALIVELVGRTLHTSNGVAKAADSAPMRSAGIVPVSTLSAASLTSRTFSAAVAWLILPFESTSSADVEVAVCTLMLRSILACWSGTFVAESSMLMTVLGLLGTRFDTLTVLVARVPPASMAAPSVDVHWPFNAAFTVISTLLAV